MSAEIYTVEVRLPVVLVKTEGKVVASCEAIGRVEAATAEEAQDRMDELARDVVDHACQRASRAQAKEVEREAREARLNDGAAQFLAKDPELEGALLALSVKFRADFPMCQIELRANSYLYVIEVAIFVDGASMSEDESQIARVRLHEHEAAWRASPVGRRWDVDLRTYLQEDEG